MVWHLTFPLSRQWVSGESTHPGKRKWDLSESLSRSNPAFLSLGENLWLPAYRRCQKLAILKRRTAGETWPRGLLTACALHQHLPLSQVQKNIASVSTAAEDRNSVLNPPQWFFKANSALNTTEVTIEHWTGLCMGLGLTWQQKHLYVYPQVFVCVIPLSQPSLYTSGKVHALLVLWG